jgi:hypothetical protein
LFFLIKIQWAPNLIIITHCILIGSSCLGYWLFIYNFVGLIYVFKRNRKFRITNIDHIPTRIYYSSKSNAGEPKYK